MKKIAFVVLTTGLEYDDRIRKEALTLSRNAEVKIFTVLSKNEATEGVTSYGVPFKSFQLKTRELFPSARFLFLKSLELYLKIRSQLKDYDIVWVHDVEPFLFPLCNRKKNMIWDLHEIPHPFLKNAFTKKLFKIAERKCKYLIHANKHRIEYLKSENLINTPEKHIEIRNFPDSQFTQSSLEDSEWNNFKSWLGDSKYIYLQGLNGASRQPFECIDSIMKLGNIKAVVIGRFDEKIKELLIQRYGKSLNERIFFRGMVEQLAIPSYIKESLLSVVLYETTQPNNRYCEPNRMYQSIIFNKPVVVGNNPPMKELVDRYDFGVSIDKDKVIASDVGKAIETIVGNYSAYIDSICSNKENILWTIQEETLSKLWQEK